jgi:putative transposase
MAMAKKATGTTDSEDDSTQFSKLANAKARIVQPLRGLRPIPGDLLAKACQEAAELLGKEEVTQQTIRNWLRDLVADGVSGLERKIREGTSELDTRIILHIEDLLIANKKYTLAKVRKRAETYARETLKINDVPSYDQVLYIRNHIDPDLLVYGREGLAAYRNEREMVNRYEADHPNHIWQCDHHILDIIVIDKVTKKELGRPWLTLIEDDYSRAFPGYHLDMRHPSSMSIALAVHHAMLPKPQERWKVHGIPSILYVDNGKDFRSIHLEEVCLNFNIELRHHERYLPRAKGKIERFFRTLEEMCIAYLDGYVGSNPQDRPERVVPRMTLEEVKAEIDRFIVEEYHERQHGTTKMKPSVRWADTPFLLREVEQEEQLDFLLKPVDRGTRVVRTDGIHVNDEPYIDREFVLEKHIGQTLKVLHDPWDPSYVKVWSEEGATKTYICTAHPQRILAGEGISPSLTEHNKAKLRKLQERTRAGAKRLAAIDKQQRAQRAAIAPPQARAPQSPHTPSVQATNAQKEREDRMRRLQYQQRRSD